MLTYLYNHICLFTNDIKGTTLSNMLKLNKCNNLAKKIQFQWSWKTNTAFMPVNYVYRVNTDTGCMEHYSFSKYIDHKIMIKTCNKMLLWNCTSTKMKKMCQYKYRSLLNK